MRGLHSAPPISRCIPPYPILRPSTEGSVLLRNFFLLCPSLIRSPWGQWEDPEEGGKVGGGGEKREKTVVKVQPPSLCDGCQQIRYFVVCSLSVIETYQLPSSNLHTPPPPSKPCELNKSFTQDGDGVTFGFVGGTTTSGLFRIEPNTGVIRLINGQINLDRDKYELNVTAMDDGKCCVESGAPVDPTNVHTSTAVVVVFITDVNVSVT